MNTVTRTSMVVRGNPLVYDHDISVLRGIINDILTENVHSSLDIGRYMTKRMFESLIGFEHVNKNGRILRRILNVMFKEYGIRLSSQDLDRLSFAYKNMISPEEKTIYFDVTNEFYWRDGMFGKSGSCWWNEYPRSRGTLQNSGGLCLRIYESPDDWFGSGRVWLYPYEDGVIMFNFYGIQPCDAAFIIRELYGINYPLRICSLTNDTSSYTPYINEDTVCMLPHDSDDDINIHVDMPTVYDAWPEYQCKECGLTHFRPDDLIFTNDGREYCHGCVGLPNKCKCGNWCTDEMCEECTNLDKFVDVFPESMFIMQDDDGDWELVW